MAVSAGGKVNASEYNAIYDIVQPVLAGPTPADLTSSVSTVAYGQAMASTRLTIPPGSTKITVDQWNALRTDLLKCYNHQNSVNGNLMTPTTSTVVAAVDYNAYLSMANTISTNAKQFDSGYSTQSSWSVNDSTGKTWGASGRSVLRHSVFFNWSGFYNMEYFFNSGGQIKFSANMPGSHGISTKNYSWQSACNKMSTVVMNYNSTYNESPSDAPGTGSAIGMRQLTGSWQKIYQKDASTYSPNRITIWARLTNSSGTFSIAYDIQFEDLNAPGGYGIDEDVSGIITSTTQVKYASGAGQVAMTGSQVPSGSLLSSMNVDASSIH
jgi:hypothetical protein